jgi:thioredoxin reductase
MEIALRNDAVIIGGGPAGLSAALLLGRGRRQVVLLDTGEGRNAPSEASHSFFTRDGTPPAELRWIGHEQLRPYENVSARPEKAVAVSGEIGRFQVTLDGGDCLESRIVILATGVRDILPDIPSVARYWGKGVFQCPFCDGWEHRDQPMAVLAPPDMVLESVHLYRTWSADLTVLTNGSWELDSDVRERLAVLGVDIITDPIERVDGDGTHANRIAFATGRELPIAVLWLRPRQEARGGLAADLGCELYEAGPITGLVRIEGVGQTTVPGVFAAGDIASPMHQVSLAVASGTAAALGATRLLIQMDNEPA